MGGEPDAALLHASCAVLDGYDDRLLDWITTSGIAIIATDNMAVEDSHGTGSTRGGQSRLPLHRHCLFRLGIHLGELWYLSELAAEMRRQQRFRCLLTAPPLRMPGAVGSPVTPVATL
jgi:kynurenine formamidase